MDENDKDPQPADACCEGDSAKASGCAPGNAAGDCACCAPPTSDHSWLKLLIAGVVLLTAAWLGIRSMTAKTVARPDAQSAAASGSAMGATPPAQAPQPGNQAQPGCCGGGKSPAASGGAAPPKCGGGTPGCCGH